MGIEEQHAQLVIDLAKDGNDIHSQTNGDVMHLIHMCLGIAGEVSEVIDTLYDFMVNSKPLARQKTVLEMGDLEFYLQGLRAGLGIPTEHIGIENSGLNMPPYRNNELCLKISTESGALIDMVKKYVIYSKRLDLEKITAKMWSLEYYVVKLRNNLGISRDEVLRCNIAKLTKRYPKGGYTDKDAIDQKDAK